ncbi:MAG: TM2 domain-containing protein [Pirellulaceae bacterium]|jgi:TM2 domain-containing membrane protein YozV|nr:TM2 domain-containing protein [Pirellulaceae bacterium]MDP7019332.1 TM2 domain-containing protein [Pirellulaceae bacterium]
MASAENRTKNKTIAALLAIGVGATGAHHYYLGSNTAGLLLLLLSCCGVGFVVALVEGIMLLVMDSEEFDSKYNHRRPESLEFVFQESP